MTRRQAGLVLAAALALFVVRAGLYVALVPVNEMPDEWQHVKRIILAQHWDEVGADHEKATRLMQEVTADYYFLDGGLKERPDPATVDGTVPPPQRLNAYFRLMGGLLNLLGVSSAVTAWYVGRIVSLISGVIVILIAFATARTIAPRNPILAAAGAAFLAVLPQFGAMSAAVSTDKPAEVVGALFFLLMARLARHSRWPEWVGVGLIVASLPFVKKTAFYFVVVAVLAAVPWWRRTVARSGQRRLIAWTIPGLAVAVFLAAAFVPPVARLAVDLMGQPLLRIWHPWFDDQLFHQPGMINALVEQLNPAHKSFWWLVYLNVISLFQSWWATYGFLTLPVEVYWYFGAGLLVMLTLAGWWRFLYRPSPDWIMAPWQGRAFGLLAAGTILNLAVVLMRQIVFDPGALSQGRYMYPSLTALTILGCQGFLALWPERVQKPALAAALLFVGAMDLAGLWRTIVPYFYFVVF